MRIALDTNRYTDLARGEPVTVKLVEQATDVYLPFIVLGELRQGFLRGSRAKENEDRLNSLLTQPNVFPLMADEQTTHEYALLSLQLRQQGTPIPTNDIWIAALVIQHDLFLHARDKHFDCLPQLKRQ